MHSLSIRPSALPLRTTAPRTRTFIATIKKRMTLAWLIFLAMSAVAVIVALLIPKTYSGSTEFLISNERVNNPIGPEKNTQAIVYLDDISEGRMNTEVSLLTSNDLLIQIVRRCNLTSSISGHRTSERQREEAALEILRRDLAVIPLKKSAIIRVTYKSRSPQTTVDVLRTLTTLYLETHLKLRGSPGSYAFFQNLWKGITDQRATAETELAKFKAEHEIVSLPEEKAIALQNEADLEKDLSNVDASTDRSLKQNSALVGLIATTPSSIVGERKTIPNQVQIQQLGILLTSLQNKRIEAASRYQPDDRSIQDLDAQIVQVRKDLAAATERTTEEVSSISNPAVNAARTDSLRAQSEAAGYRAQAGVIRNKMSANRSRLIALDKETPAYNLLSENVARLTELDHEYRQKVDAAQVTKLLDQDHISNVAVAEQPFASSKPAPPRFGMMVGLGILWSCVFALVGIYIVDRLSPRVASVADVERCLGAPVLALVTASNHPAFLDTHLSGVTRSLSRHSGTDLWRTA